MGGPLIPGVLLVGCGRNGERRARAIADARLVGCADVDITRARAVASLHPDAIATSDWRDLIRSPDVDIVIVATPNAQLPVVAAAAIENAKHVLIEKPCGRSAADLEHLIELQHRHGVVVRAGFNHRFHPAMQRAREIVSAGTIGELMFVRGRYGHGGRLGYENEWRADPEISGGGELIDQGVHLIDLARWFLGDLTHAAGLARTFYWSMPVDDNAFLILENASGNVAFLHASCTEWKNLFSFEIYGKQGKLHAEGLGGSYGVERLALYRMLPKMGPPETTIWEYPGADESWQHEFEALLETVQKRRAPDATLSDALSVLRIVETVYRSSGYAAH